MPTYTERQQRLLKWNKGERIEVKSGYPKLSEMRDGQMEIRNVRGEGLCIVLRHSSELYTIPFQDKYMDLVKRRKHTFKAAKGKGGISDLEGESIVSQGSTEDPIVNTKFLRADGDGTCSWNVPVGSGGTVQNSIITLVAGNGLSLSGSGSFKTNQSTNQTITFTIADNALAFTKIADLARGSILYGNSSAATAELTKGTSTTVLKSDGTDISWGGNYSYLGFGHDAAISSSKTSELATADGSTNAQGYKMPRAGTITAMTVYTNSTINTGGTANAIAFYIYKNNSQQATYTLVLADGVDGGSVVFGTALAFAAGDRIGVKNVLTNYSSGSMTNTAVLVEVTT